MSEKLEELQFKPDGDVELENNATITQDQAKKIRYDLLQKGSNHQELAQDVWGSMYYVIVKDFPDMIHDPLNVPRENALRMIFVTICYIVNMFLQVTLLYYIGLFVTLPAVRAAQDTYSSFHAKTFDKDGKLSVELFHKLPGDEQGSICQIVLSSRLFVGAILFLWVAQCFSELRTIQRRTRFLSQLPPLPEGFKTSEMVMETYNGEELKCLFVCVDVTTKVLLWILIFIPSICVAVCLLSLGCLWLTASMSFGDLILNSLALAFVVEVDELILEVFLPPRLADNISETFMALPGKHDFTEEEKKNAELDGYKRSGGFLLFCFAFVVLFVYKQPVIPGYAWDIAPICQEYNQEHRSPWCNPLSGDCFPRGVSEL